MNELRGCQKYSMGPNFIYFGAQKYGYRPIPSEIETEELMKLIGVLETMGNDVTLLKKWYRKDNNKVVKPRSPFFCIKSIQSIITSIGFTATHLLIIFELRQHIY